MIKLFKEFLIKEVFNSKVDEIDTVKPIISKIIIPKDSNYNIVDEEGNKMMLVPYRETIKYDTLKIKLEGGGSLFINKPAQYTLKYIKALN